MGFSVKKHSIFAQLTCFEQKMSKPARGLSKKRHGKRCILFLQVLIHPFHVRGGSNEESHEFCSRGDYPGQHAACHKRQRCA
jgi:hypothetical protein